MKKYGLNQNGVTLVEVMMALVILILASQMIIAGTFFTIRLEKQTEEIRIIGNEIDRNLREKEDCVPGVIRLDLGDGNEITRDGWMYRYEEEQGGTFSINVFTVEKSLLTGGVKE